MSSDAVEVLAMAQMVRAGMPLAGRTNHVSSGVQAELTRLLEVNQSVGGPVAATLQRFAQVLRRREALVQAIQVAATGPRASAKLVMNLPLLVLLGGAISGIPVIRIFGTSWLASASLGLGLILYWLGSKWTNKLLAASQPSNSDPGFELELLAISVGAGLPLGFACKQLGLDPGSVEFIGNQIPSLQLITERADELRLEMHTADRLRIQRVSVAILWPLGITVLPAFVLVAIVPLALAMALG